MSHHEGITQKGAPSGCQELPIKKLGEGDSRSLPENFVLGDM
jgi:hypothetical protein